MLREPQRKSPYQLSFQILTKFLILSILRIFEFRVFHSHRSRDDPSHCTVYTGILTSKYKLRLTPY